MKREQIETENIKVSTNTTKISSRYSHNVQFTKKRKKKRNVR
jgi:hypothetical protein